MSEELYRNKIASIKKQQATEETALTKARAAAAKYRSDVAKERAKITPRTSDSMGSHLSAGLRRPLRREPPRKTARCRAPGPRSLPGGASSWTVVAPCSPVAPATAPHPGVGPAGPGRRAHQRPRRSHLRLAWRKWKAALLARKE
jgi:hypothetical protein